MGWRITLRLDLGDLGLGDLGDLDMGTRNGRSDLQNKREGKIDN